MIKRVIWLAVALVAAAIIAFMIFTPTPYKPGGGVLIAD